MKDNFGTINCIEKFENKSTINEKGNSINVDFLKRPINNRDSLKMETQNILIPSNLRKYSKASKQVK